jgi:primase-polymerase (primpol)-like protein
MSIIPTNIPPELTQLPQWVLWRYENGGGPKPTKVPYQARAHLYRADSTDPRTWAGYQTAREMALYHGESVAGIGFVFSQKDPFCGIDCDSVWPSDATETPVWAAGILEQFADTYSEVSPSGTGVKLWCKARAPRSGKWPIDSGAIEVYNDNRYFAMTGCHAGVLAISDHQLDVEALVANLDEDRHPRVPTKSRIVPEVIAQGRRHNTLISLAGTMWCRGLTAEAIEAALLITNQAQCNPPYGPAHIHKIVRSIQRWER